MTDREDFLRRIKETFKIEASEGITKITDALLALEKNPPEAEKQGLIEDMYRESHSLKGASRAVNLTGIEHVCQELETVFSSLKSGKSQLDQGMFNLFHKAVNILQDSLGKVGEEQNEGLEHKVSELLLELSRKPSDPILSESKRDPQNKIPGKPAYQSDPKESSKPITEVPNTIRISSYKIDELLYQAEEMLDLKHIFSQLNDRVLSIFMKFNDSDRMFLESLHSLEDLRSGLEMNPNSSPGPQVYRNITELESNLKQSSSILKTIGAELSAIRKYMTLESYNNSTKTENLLEEVKGIILVPASTILNIIPKAARDLAIAAGKELDIEITGGDIEIDRRILDEIKSPLLHIIRNCVDHGIEKTESRIKKNKPGKGSIRISVDRIENKLVEIRVADDGEGVDMDKLRRHYIKSESVTEKEAKQLSEKVLLDYIFKSGVSTSDMITDISGRGLGMAIVKEKIEQIGGSVFIRSSPGEGSEFRIQTPLSLVTFRGVLIAADEQKFVLPTAKINTILRLDKSVVRTVENKATVPYQNGIIPLIYLADVLEIPMKDSEDNHIIVIVLGQNNQVGFKVDEILQEDVYLVKNFNAQLSRVRNISGATIIGSGKVIPVLNVADLLKSATKESSQRMGIQESQTEKKKSKVLVVEDSITSRMLIKNILESSGYDVTTAIDGKEGFTFLKETAFDLVVSDVDMPRMNGFDLTSNIRSDQALLEIPVILLTSLSKKEDRERGIEVGANAYIVKSSFDQSNLLEVVERFI